MTKSHVKETSILKPIRVRSDVARKTTMLQRRKGSTKAGEHKLKPLSFDPLFLFKRESLTLKPVQVKAIYSAG
jgi:hypothetical protein